MQRGEPSTNITAFRSTPQRSSAGLHLSSHLCPVSGFCLFVFFTRPGCAAAIFTFLTAEQRVPDSSSLSSAHILRPLLDVQPNERLRLVQHPPTVRWNSICCLIGTGEKNVWAYLVLAEFQMLRRHWSAQTRVAGLQLPRGGEILSQKHYYSLLVNPNTCKLSNSSSKSKVGAEITSFITIQWYIDLFG